VAGVFADGQLGELVGGADAAVETHEMILAVAATDT
jgi:hypothetical protein